jgi:hypothetical protein
MTRKLLLGHLLHRRHTLPTDEAGFSRFLDGPTEPAGSPSFRGRPTGRLAFAGEGLAVPSRVFLVLPFGRPGRRLIGSAELDATGWGSTLRFNVCS